MPKDDRAQTIGDFRDAVNMSRRELEAWLDRDESTQVGSKQGSSESVGHRSGRRIVRLLDTKRDDLSEADLAHMRKVVGYVHRHLAQRPSGNVKDSPGVPRS